MRMANTDLKYGKLQVLVSTVLPAYRTNQFVIDTIQKIAGAICKEDIKDALIWNQGPLAKVDDLSDGKLGLFIAGIHSDVLYIDRKVVVGRQEGNGKRYTPSGDLVELATVVLLHELTHWADDQDGNHAPGEAGFLFEKQVFGGIVN